MVQDWNISRGQNLKASKLAMKSSQQCFFPPTYMYILRSTPSEFTMLHDILQFRSQSSNPTACHFI